MADGFVQVAPDSTGKQVDTSELLVGVITRERQRMVLGDNADAAGLAAVQNITPVGTEYGIVTRPIPSGVQTISQLESSTTGSISAVAGSVTLNLSGSPSTSIVDVRGTWTGTLTWEVSSNGVDFDVVGAQAVGGGSGAVQTTAFNGQYQPSVAGMVALRVRATAWTSGTANITLRASNAVSRVFLNTVAVQGTTQTGGVASLPMWGTGSVPNNATQNAVVTSLRDPVPAGANIIGSVSQVPTTTGGLSVFKKISAATTNAATIKAAPGQVYGWYLYNNAASTRFIKLYDKATALVVGTDVPVLTLPLPAGAAANVSIDNGIAFLAGIGCAITANMADADTTAIAVNDVLINVFYN